MPFRQKMQNAIPPAYEPLSIALSFQLRYAKTAKRCAYELGDDFYDLEEIRKALGKVTIGEERRIPTLDELVYVAENSANARKGVNRFTLIDHGGIWAVKANYVYDKRPARSGKSSRFSAHQRSHRANACAKRHDESEEAASDEECWRASGQNSGEWRRQPRGRADKGRGKAETPSEEWGQDGAAVATSVEAAGQHAEGVTIDSGWVPEGQMEEDWGLKEALASGGWSERERQGKAFWEQWPAEEEHQSEEREQRPKEEEQQQPEEREHWPEEEEHQGEEWEQWPEEEEYQGEKREQWPVEEEHQGEEWEQRPKEEDQQQPEEREQRPEQEELQVAASSETEWQGRGFGQTQQQSTECGQWSDEEKRHQIGKREQEGSETEVAHRETCVNNKNETEGELTNEHELESNLGSAVPEYIFGQREHTTRCHKGAGKGKEPAVAVIAPLPAPQPSAPQHPPADVHHQPSSESTAASSEMTGAVSPSVTPLCESVLAAGNAASSVAAPSTVQRTSPALIVMAPPLSSVPSATASVAVIPTPHRVEKPALPVYDSQDSAPSPSRFVNITPPSNASPKPSAPLPYKPAPSSTTPRPASACVPPSLSPIAKPTAVHCEPKPPPLRVPVRPAIRLVFSPNAVPKPGLLAGGFLSNAAPSPAANSKPVTLPPSSQPVLAGGFSSNAGPPPANSKPATLPPSPKPVAPQLPRLMSTVPPKPPVPRVSTSLRPLLPPSTAKPWDEGLQNAPQPVSNNAGMRGCSPVVVKKPPPMRPRV
eukprot:GEMP01008614.1.p1 GENE.GEMP01008614.1~~GEMP01008614.1.p1  ORF type:complete len:766 (+),score=182.34 GEMP01008614.1:97-2394(+)